MSYARDHYIESRHNREYTCTVTLNGVEMDVDYIGDIGAVYIERILTKRGDDITGLLDWLESGTNNLVELVEKDWEGETVNKFYVGQRVRFVKVVIQGPKDGKAPLVPLGSLGEVVGFGGVNNAAGHFTSGYVHVVFDGIDSGHRGVAFPGCYGCHPNALEPIEDADDSRQVTTWSQCIWKPVGVAA